MLKLLYHNIKFFKSIALLLCFVMMSLVGRGQTNLVPNPSFEQYTNCPDNSTDASTRAGKPDIWFKPDRRGAGYWNVCSNGIATNGGIPFRSILDGNSYQETKSGNAYILMFYYNPSLNYVEAKLLDSLKANKYYYGNIM
jgi:hypothetical protein